MNDPTTASSLFHSFAALIVNESCLKDCLTQGKLEFTEKFYVLLSYALRQ